MTGMTDEEWERLQDGFDTRRLLDAVGDVDESNSLRSNTVCKAFLGSLLWLLL
jgi:hypothetical protein